ncbi:unnamed protein product [Mucor hiemalis]
MRKTSLLLTYSKIIKNVIAQTLLQMEIGALCKVTNCSKQMMNAFKKQVILSTMISEEYKQEKGLKRQKLKNEYILSTKIKRYKIVIITKILFSYMTHCLHSLDSLLRGGICTSQIVEICGSTGADTDRFTIQLLTSFISTYHGDDLHVFDTTGMFEPRSMKSTNNALERITCTHLHDLNHFYVSLDNLTTLFTIKEKDSPPSLLLIHDISILLSDWTKIDKLFYTLKSISRLNCMIVILNNTTTDFTTNQYEIHWNPFIDIRLSLDKDNRVKVVKSRRHYQQL